MKKLILSLMLMYAVVATAQVDDMYFVPKKSENKNKTVNSNNKQQFVTVPEGISDNEEWNNFDEDEYNRRGYLSSQGYEDAEYDTYADDEEETYSSQSAIEDEYIYSSRILRFHSPRIAMLSSPWYWDIVYTSGVDNWLVCDDGIYWDVYPAYNYYSSWYYPTWSWSFTFGHWGYYNHYSWNHWHTPVWHDYHHHYYLHWHGSHNGYWAGSFGARDNRRPPVIDMRTGKTYASNDRGNRVTTRNNNNVQQSNNSGYAGGGNVREESSQRNNNRQNSYVRTGRTGRTTVNGAQRVEADNKSETTVRNNKTPNRTNYRGTDAGKTRRENRTGVQNNSSSGKERVYNRPSSTRTTSRSTNVERSSSNNSSSSSVSRSSGSSRSSYGGGGGSRGGSSRGGRR